MRDATTPLAQLDPLPPEERHALLDGVHADLPHHPHPTPFITAFEHQAALRPDAVALAWEGGTLSYDSLDRRANRLAHRLRALGVGRERVVALAMERAPETVAALLATAKAGGAFLPLDPDAPRERLRDILDQSAPVVLLTQSRWQERLAELHPTTLALDNDDTPLTSGS